MNLIGLEREKRAKSLDRLTALFQRYKAKTATRLRETRPLYV